MIQYKSNKMRKDRPINWFNRAKVTVMNLLRNTILICLLLTPIVLYATAKEPIEEENLEIEIPVEVEIVEEEPVLTEQELIEREIQEVFGDKWKLAYAVMMSEGGGKVKAINYNSDRVKSVDRGLFQINSYWHPDVSIECAFDMECNVKEAYRISKGGTDWTLWYGYTDGHYLKFL